MEMTSYDTHKRSMPRRKKRDDTLLVYKKSLVENDHLSSGVVQSDYYQRSRGIPIDNGVPSSSYYRPPLTGIHKQDDDFCDHPEPSSSLYYSAPSAPSFSRSFRSQTPTRTHMAKKNHHNLVHKQVLNRDNPAVDLASNSILSYGCFCCQCVRTSEVGITENFGKFDSLLEPGFYCLLWPFSDISGRLSLRIQQLEVICESKTSDSVFCTIVVTVNYRIIAQRSYDAYYRLVDPRNQIRSYIFDVIRSVVPKLTLDELFLSKEAIASNVLKQLTNVMLDYGYAIISTYVTDIRPDALVVQSMNEMNTAKRLKEAMIHKAEAGKIQRIKAAEAHSEVAYLSGLGTAGQQKAIAKSMKESFIQHLGPYDINDTSIEESPSTRQKDVIELLLITQYLDMLVSVSTSNGGNGCNGHIFLRCEPKEVLRLQERTCGHAQSDSIIVDIPDYLS